MRRGPALIGGAGVLLLACVVLAGAHTPPLLDNGPAAVGSTPNVPVPRAPRVHLGGHLHLPDWVSIVFAALLVGYLLFVILLVLVGHREALESDEDDPRAMEDEIPPPDWAASLRAELSSGARRGLEDLANGSPRNAIVACWMRLERATRHVGLEPHPAETSHEYAARVMRLLPMDSEAVASLGSLYREARFSAHRITEAQRQQARRALAVLVDDLGRPRADASNTRAAVQQDELPGGRGPVLASPR